MPAAARERNLLEAWLHGWAVILAVITATVALVLAIMLLCGCALEAQHLGMIAAGMIAAACFAFFARLARTP